MSNKIKYFLHIIITLLSTSVWADVYLTPWIGYTGGGKVIAQNEMIYDLEGSASYAITGEIDLQDGRIGLFYSNQGTNVDDINLESNIHYLQFQSSVYYPDRRRSLILFGHRIRCVIYRRGLG